MAKGNVKIDEKYCKGCGLCVEVCPQKILRLAKDRLTVSGFNPCEVVDSSKCIACCSCAKMCPDAAITVKLIG